jgi:hypothetical protein
VGQRARPEGLSHHEGAFLRAVDTIQSRLSEMKANAKLCAKEYIDAPGKCRELVEALKEVIL